MCNRINQVKRPDQPVFNVLIEDGFLRPSQAVQTIKLERSKSEVRAG